MHPSRIGIDSAVPLLTRTMLATRSHRCDDCLIANTGPRSSVEVVGQYLIETLRDEDDAARWQQHLTRPGIAAVQRMLERGPQVVVTPHERPMREIQALALLLRNAGMPLLAVVNDGTTRRVVSFVLTGRSPLHLVNAYGALRRGESVLFVLWRSPTRRRGLLPWEAPDAEARPAAGPIALARRAGVPLTIAQLNVTGRRVARIDLVERLWTDGGRDLDDESAALTSSLSARS